MGVVDNDTVGVKDIVGELEEVKEMVGEKEGVLEAVGW